MLCWKPTIGATNLGDRPICERFLDLPTNCSNETCCMNQQFPDQSNGNGFQEFNESCLDGGLHCVGNTGCMLCWRPTVAAFNLGDRPVCTRFMDQLPVASNEFNCTNEDCCIDHQDVNSTDGNFFFQFNESCLNGGLHCVEFSGCSLCFKPLVGGINLGDRPICGRFLNTIKNCSDDTCCIDQQNPNQSNGIGYLEFSASCLHGGLHCVADTGCSFCVNPSQLLGNNTGDSSICKRYL
jgi:uncharacterized protein Usg